MSGTKSTRPLRVCHLSASGPRRHSGRLVIEKGKIRLRRESLNTVAAAQALNPNGAADLPPPEGEIFSVPPDYMS